MKTVSLLLLFLLLSLATSLRGQGAFAYDQESSTNETPFWGSGGVMQQIATPWGQSFTPSLSAVGFIRLKLYDNNTNNSLGVTIYLNLRTDSITGPILGSTTPVFLPNGAGGTANFFFSNPVPLSPGALYLFEPIVQSGDLWRIDASEYGYPRGTAFAGGVAAPGSDLWFREGVFTPEPSTLSLVVISALALGIRAKGRTQRTHDSIPPR